MEAPLEELVQKAAQGDQAALEDIVKRIQDRIYGLALRMLWHPADAEDAAQEILVRVITNLGSFRGESAFATWVYRVASNYLLTTRKRRAELPEITFEDFGKQLDEGLSDEPIDVAEAVEHKLLIDEVRIGCTHGMLLCLDRDHRLAYILGEILELNGKDGGYVLGISTAAFRKRLSRARSRILEFMHRKCGIFDPANPCRCTRRVKHAVEIGRIEPRNLLFSGAASGGGVGETIIDRIHDIERMRRVSAIYRSAPEYPAPDTYLVRLREMIESKELGVLRE